MLHFMTVTITKPSTFHRGKMVTLVNKYRLTWEDVKWRLNETRTWAKNGANRSYSITLAAYRGQSLD